ADALEDAAVGGDGRVGEVVVESAQVHLAGRRGILENGLHLTGEEEALPGLPIEERLLAEAVAGHEHRSVAAVPDGEGEHAPEALDAGGPVLFPGVDDRLRV